MIGNASIIQRIDKIEMISFTDYASFSNCSCLLRDWPRSRLKYSHNKPTRPITRPVIVGLFFHELLREITQLYGLSVQEGVREIRSLYKQQVTEYKLRYAISLNSVSMRFDYWPEMSAILKTVIRVYKRDLQSTYSPERELKISSGTERIFGIVDEFVKTGCGIIIREYKTTRDVTKLMQEKYIDQLHFYAILVKEEYGQNPKEMHLEGLLGAECEIEIEEERITRIEREVSVFLSRVDEAIENHTDLANLCVVTKSNCLGCLYNMTCPEILFGGHQSALGLGNELALAHINDIDFEKSILFVEVLGGTSATSGKARIELSPSSIAATEFEIDRQVVISHIIKSGEGVLVASDRSQALFYEAPQ